MRIGLLARTGIVSLLVVGVLTIAVGVYYLMSYTATLNASLIERVKTTMEMYQPILVNDLVTCNDLGLLSHLETIENGDDVVYAVIVDSNSKVLGHSDVYQIGKIFNDDMTQWAVRAKEFAYKETIENNKRLFVCTSPLGNAAQGNVAFLMMGVSRKTVDTAATTARNNFFMSIGALGAFLFVLLMVYFYWEVVRPLTLIRDGITLMKTHLSELKCSVPMNTEVGDIYRTVNELIAGIQEKMKTFEHQQTLSLDAECKIAEQLFSVLYRDALFAMVDDDNRVMFSNIPSEINDKVTKGTHILDAFNDSDIIHIVTEAYSKKGTVITGSVTWHAQQYTLMAFVIKAKGEWEGKMFVVFQKKMQNA